MSFNATLTTAGRTAMITLHGALDKDSDQEFREKVERAATLDVSELVLDMSALQQLSAAGIRAIAYARQQMPDDVQVVIASPVEQVRRTLLAADFGDSMVIRE
ncbi:MAG: STAS domain-containing protein [Pseudonocardiales bacterium]|nr:STAS domain-containing protein [Pseudonocardiales bacterium]MBV9729491.1 STAS domain-containing protein [Pseudonocardiales bacterium]